MAIAAAAIVLLFLLAGWILAGGRPSAQKVSAVMISSTAEDVAEFGQPAGPAGEPALPPMLPELACYRADSCARHWIEHVSDLPGALQRARSMGLDCDAGLHRLRQTLAADSPGPLRQDALTAAQAIGCQLWFVGQAIADTQLRSAQSTMERLKDSRDWSILRMNIDSSRTAFAGQARLLHLHAEAMVAVLHLRPDLSLPVGQMAESGISDLKWPRLQSPWPMCRGRPPAYAWSDKTLKLGFKAWVVGELCDRANPKLLNLLSGGRPAASTRWVDVDMPDRVRLADDYLQIAGPIDLGVDSACQRVTTMIHAPVPVHLVDAGLHFKAVWLAAQMVQENVPPAARAAWLQRKQGQVPDGTHRVSAAEDGQTLVVRRWASELFPGCQFSRPLFVALQTSEDWTKGAARGASRPRRQ